MLVVVVNIRSIYIMYEGGSKAAGVTSPSKKKFQQPAINNNITLTQPQPTYKPLIRSQCERNLQQSASTLLASPKSSRTDKPNRSATACPRNEDLLGHLAQHSW